MTEGGTCAWKCFPRYLGPNPTWCHCPCRRRPMTSLLGENLTLGNGPALSLWGPTGTPSTQFPGVASRIQAEIGGPGGGACECVTYTAKGTEQGSLGH